MFSVSSTLKRRHYNVISNEHDKHRRRNVAFEVEHKRMERYGIRSTHCVFNQIRCVWEQIEKRSRFLCICDYAGISRCVHCVHCSMHYVHRLSMFHFLFEIFVGLLLFADIIDRMEME